MTYPDSVVLMRGNHEAPAEFPFTSHDFPFQLVDRFGEADGKTIYRKVLKLFRDLALVIVVARLLLVHGGLPTDERVFPGYRSILSSERNDELHMRVLEEVLWNDPRQISSTNGWEKSRRGIGRHFGEEITKKWLEVFEAKCVVRGHEPCQGFRIDHAGRVLTLFSCHGPYPSFKAAYLLIPEANLQGVRDANGLVPFIRYPLSP
jgi:protein phosphatase